VELSCLCKIFYHVSHFVSLASQILQYMVESIDLCCLSVDSCFVHRLMLCLFISTGHYQFHLTVNDELLSGSRFVEHCVYPSFLYVHWCLNMTVNWTVLNKMTICMYTTNKDLSRVHVNRLVIHVVFCDYWWRLVTDMQSSSGSSTLPWNAGHKTCLF